VVFHHIARDVAILRQGVGGHRLGLGERLETKLAVEAVRAGAIPFERHLAMPHAPQVGVTAAGVVGIAAISHRSVRAGRPIVALGIQLPHDFWQEHIEQSSIVLPAHRGLSPLGAHQPHLELVVATPQRQAWMVA